MRNQRFFSIFFFVAWMLNMGLFSESMVSPMTSVVQENNSGSKPSAKIDQLFKDLIDIKNPKPKEKKFLDKIKENPKKTTAGVVTGGTLLYKLTPKKSSDSSSINDESWNSSVPVKKESETMNQEKSLAIPSMDTMEPHPLAPLKQEFSSHGLTAPLVPVNNSGVGAVEENKSFIPSNNTSNNNINTKPSLAVNPSNSGSYTGAQSSIFNGSGPQGSIKKSKDSMKEEALSKISQLKKTPTASPTNQSPTNRDNKLNQQIVNAQGILGQKIQIPNQSSLIIDGPEVNNEKAQQDLLSQMKKVPNFYQWIQNEDNLLTVNNIMAYENNFNNLKRIYENAHSKKFLNDINALNVVKKFFLQSDPLLNFEQIFQSLGPQESLKILLSPMVVENIQLESQQNFQLESQQKPIINHSPSNDLFDQSSINFNPKDVMIYQDQEGSIEAIDENFSKPQSHNESKELLYQMTKKQQPNRFQELLTTAPVTNFQQQNMIPIPPVLFQDNVMGNKNQQVIMAAPLTKEPLTTISPNNFQQQNMIPIKPILFQDNVMGNKNQQVIMDAPLTKEPLSTISPNNFQQQNMIPIKPILFQDNVMGNKNQQVIMAAPLTKEPLTTISPNNFQQQNMTPINPLLFQDNSMANRGNGLMKDIPLTPEKIIPVFNENFSLVKENFSLVNDTPEFPCDITSNNLLSLGKIMEPAPSINCTMNQEATVIMTTTNQGPSIKEESIDGDNLKLLLDHPTIMVDTYGMDLMEDVVKTSVVHVAEEIIEEQQMEASNKTQAITKGIMDNILAQWTDQKFQSTLNDCLIKGKKLQENSAITHFIQGEIFNIILEKTMYYHQSKIIGDQLIQEELNNIVNNIFQEKVQQMPVSNGLSIIKEEGSMPLDESSLIEKPMDIMKEKTMEPIKVITDVPGFANDTLTSQQNSSESSHGSDESSHQIKTFDLAEDTIQHSISSGSDIPEENQTQEYPSYDVQIAVNKPSFHTLIINYKPNGLIKDETIVKAYEIAQQYKIILEYYKVLSKTNDTQIIENKNIIWTEKAYDDLLKNFDTMVTIAHDKKWNPLEKIKIIYENLYTLLHTHIKENLENFYTTILMEDNNYDYSQLIIHREKIIKFINLNIKWLDLMKFPNVSQEIINNINYFIGTVLIYGHQWDTNTNVMKFFQGITIDQPFINNIKDLKIIEIMGQGLRSDIQVVDRKSWEKNMHLAFKSPKNFQWLLEAYIKNSLKEPSATEKLKDFIEDVNDYITAQKFFQGGDLDQLIMEKTVNYNNIKEHLSLMTNYMDDRKQLIQQAIQMVGKHKNIPTSKVKGGIETLDAKHHIHSESKMMTVNSTSQQSQIYKNLIGRPTHSKKNSMILPEKFQDLTGNSIHKNPTSRIEVPLQMTPIHHQDKEQGFFNVLDPVMASIKPTMDNLTHKVADTWNNLDNPFKNFFSQNDHNPIKNTGDTIRTTAKKHQPLTNQIINYNKKSQEAPAILTNKNPSQQPLNRETLGHQGHKKTMGLEMMGAATIGSSTMVKNRDSRWSQVKNLLSNGKNKSRGSSENRDQLTFKPLFDNNFMKEYEEAQKQQEIQRQIENKVERKSTGSSSPKKILENFNEMSGIPLDTNKTYVPDLTNVIRSKDDQFSGDSV